MYEENEVDVYADEDTFVEVDDELDYFDAFDDGDALASAGWGTDEDYGFYGSDDY